MTQIGQQPYPFTNDLKATSANQNQYYDTILLANAAIKGQTGAQYFMKYDSAVMRGKIAGAASFTSSGHITLAGVVTNYPIHPAGIINIAPAGGVQMSFVSTSAQDSAAGTGVRTLIMGYIEDTTLLAKTETIAMNGTTPVLSVATNIRFINTITTVTAGAGLAPAGTITVTNGGLTYGQIDIGHKIQSSSFRMIPVGKTFYPHELIVSSNSGKTGTTSIFHIVAWNGTMFIPSNAMGLEDQATVIMLRAGRGIPAGSIIGVEVTTSNLAQLTASFVGILENT